MRPMLNPLACASITDPSGHVRYLIKPQTQTL